MNDFFGGVGAFVVGAIVATAMAIAVLSIPRADHVAAVDARLTSWESCGATQLWRARVPGGWVYAYESRGLCFVPDPASATAVPR